jgi:hemoglobin
MKEPRCLMKHDTFNRWPSFVLSILGMAAAVAFSGCGSSPAKQANANFFTSGSREADQRASQRMAQSEQLSGTGEEKGVKKATPDATGRQAGGGAETNQAVVAKGKLALFDRLGGQAGISNLVADFLPRVMDDPRVNWARKDVTQGGFSVHYSRSVTWPETPANVAQLQEHLVQFIALATGGPSKYQGKEIRSTHADMHIANDEFDAAVGDLKVSLDRLQIANTEQKELLAIVESTRPEIVHER